MIAEQGQGTSPLSLDEYSSTRSASLSSTPHLASPGRLASLALLDAVLAMAPRHAAALRSRASILNVVGRAWEGLAEADRSISVAEEAIELSRRCSGGGGVIVSETVMSPPPSFSSNPTIGHIREAALSSSAIGATTAEGGGHCCPSRSIGFMPESKVTVAVGGGLLWTGGGGGGGEGGWPEAMFDMIKGLILRGCLRQKMGRRKTAENDYRWALDMCRQQKCCFEHPKSDRNRGGDNSATKEGGDSAMQQYRDRASGNEAHRNDDRPQRRKTALGPLIGRWADFEAENPDDEEYGGVEGKEKHARVSEERSSAEQLTSEYSKQTHGKGKKLASEGRGGPAVDGRWADYCEVLRLESLIRHNLATLHMAALLGGDTRTAFHKVCIAPLSVNFVRESAVAMLISVPYSSARGFSAGFHVMFLVP